MKHKVTMMLLLFFGLAIVMSSLPATADTWTLTLSPGNCGTGASCDTFSFTTTVVENSPTSFTVTFDVKNVGAGNPLVFDNAYLQGFGLTLFQGSITGATVASTNPTLPDGSYSLVPNTTFNDGNNNCKGGKAGGLCLQVTTPGLIHLTQAKPEQSFTFMVTLASGSSLITDSWHIMADGTVTADGSRGGNVFALSNDGVPTDPPTRVPEPTSMAVFGAGLIGIAQLIRRKARK